MTIPTSAIRSRVLLASRQAGAPAKQGPYGALFHLETTMAKMPMKTPGKGKGKGGGKKPC
jgi:hypothetical protein